MDSLISLGDVTKRYDNAGQPAVDRIRLEVAPGEAVAVMGPPGSGKSTLLNLTAGLDRPTSVPGSRLGCRPGAAAGAAMLTCIAVLAACTAGPARQTSAPAAGAPAGGAGHVLHVGR